MGKQSSQPLADQLKSYVTPFRYDGSGEFHLKSYKTAEKGGLDKEKGEKIIEANRRRLVDFQEKLYAQDRWAVLLILQAMDAAGKDSTIKHVMSGLNPQGCQVCAFKTPSAEELQHDFLWRTSRSLPERGRIGIFNRSYYEEVLVVRVHPEFLAAEKMPERLVSEDIWRNRFEDIKSFERYLWRNGIAVLKFFLHLSKEEQKKRFLERLDAPEKNWKFSINDALERKHWGKYMQAYEEMIRNTSTKRAPWYIVPADHKWFARIVVAEALIDALEGLDLSFPEVDAEKRKELKAARAALERDA